MQLETGAAIGLTSFGIWEVFSNYKDTAPDLDDVHKAPPGDLHIDQRLMDTDLLVGVIALAAGGLASYLAKTPVPFVAVAFTFGAVSLYYHAIANRYPPEGLSLDNGS